ncbi:alpha/beta fold hydrolase [Actinoplanes sp. M2I2]|uniref:alpha/beta fold hydrolase n=1 Tax=Actinoplanes sp. M2I2 TaxID=1734444 RepID=UPI0020208CEF|nr:alpha/beta fold hydrolase [Actinoplanes sp. M2I2]
MRVLGTAGVHPSGGAAPRLERKARELLSILTVRAPAAVTLDELARLLWDDPPPSAVKTVRSHLSRVRVALRAAEPGADIERAGRDGYRLALAPERTDVGSVAAARARARRLLADGRPDSAAAVLAEARTVWRADPELPGTVAAEALRQGWRRERRLLVQEHLGCVVAGDDPGSALGELEQLTTADPLDEPLWVHYVRALHRAGRPNEALRAAAAARAALVEVGLDPSAALRDAQAEALRSAPPAATATPIRYATDRDGSTAFTRLSGDGRDLVVLNPGMITVDGLLDGAYARRALTALAGHAAVVCLDRRGIGLSDPLDPLRTPLDQWVTDVGRVLDTLGIGRADLFANFDTGLVALEFAARHPDRVRSLVLAQCYPRYTRGPDYPYGLDQATTDTLIHDTVSPADPAHGVDSVAQAAPSVAADEDFRRWWNRLGRRAASPAVALAVRTVATGTDLRHRLPGIAAPTLVLHRRNCLNVDVGHASYLATHLPDARLRTTPGTDALWFTDSADLLRHTVDFLRPR